MPHGLVREHLLAALLESPEEGILGVSLDGVIETWGRGAELIYGYTVQEIVGQPLSRLVPPHELPGLETVFSEPGAPNSMCSSISERLHKDGSRIFLKIKRLLVRDDHGEVRGVLESACTLSSCGGNTTSEWPLQSIVEQMPGFFWTTDRNLRIRSNWGKGMAAAKIHPGTLVGRSVFEFLGSADRHRTPIREHCDALCGIASNFEYHWRNRFLEIRLEPLRAASGEINGCLALATDITGRKNSEEQALYQARHDALTGLANYREFMERLEQEVSRAERSHHSFTLLLLDLDGLKRINDFQGHLAGNRALKRLAAIMSEHCRSTDLAVRYGGDEFAVVLIDSDKGMAAQVAQRIGNGLRSDRAEPVLSVSIGIGVYPDDGRTAAELIESADRQLYKCKRGENKPAVSASIQTFETKRAAR